MSFFSKPYGTGAPLNVYMFAPRNLSRHVATFWRDPKYFRSRTGVVLYQILHPNHPWLTAGSIRLLDKQLNRSMAGFEWGSGKSTIWFASRLKSLISVEHDPKWHATVRRRIRLRGISNIDYRLVPTDRGDDDYANQILAIPDASLDFVLVDGQARDRCIALAVQKVRAGGYLVVDNSDADYDITPCRGFPALRTTNGVWETTIFVRPETEMISRPSGIGAATQGNGG